MGRKAISRVGEKFHRLTVLEQWREDETTWTKCLCDCGKTALIRLGPIVAGKTRSCGCLVAERKPSRRVDRTGVRYGRLVALSESPERRASGNRMWLCRCDCGSEVLVEGGNLQAGTTQSCGCLHRDSVRQTHGLSGTPTYKAYNAMKQRCLNPKNNRYADYGGRGITVCPEWQASFEAFLADVGERPEGMSLDRIEVDGNYEKSNVRWATDAEQRVNQRRKIRHQDAPEAGAVCRLCHRRRPTRQTTIRRRTTMPA